MNWRDGGEGNEMRAVSMRCDRSDTVRLFVVSVWRLDIAKVAVQVSETTNTD